MKTKILTMVFAIATNIALAHNQGSVLNLRLSDNTPFKVFVDGQCVGGISTRVQIGNLADGRHSVEVYRINYFRGRERMHNVYNGFVRIDRHTETFATIDPHCRSIRYDRVVALRHDDWRPHDNRNGDKHPKHHGRPYYGDAGMAEPMGPFAISQPDFIRLKETLGNAGFENTRLNIYRQAVSTNYFTSAQVGELLDLFWFESTKLEAAKLAYPKTIDPQNYYTVNNNFSFSSSVDELSEYVAMR